MSRRFHVFEFGLDGKKVGTYSAGTEVEARRKAAEEYGFSPADYRAEQVRERERVKCELCGWEFMSPKRFFNRERIYIRCTLCTAEADIRHKAHVLLKAQEKYDDALAKRAKKYGLTPAEYEMLKKQKKLPPVKD